MESTIRFRVHGSQICDALARRAEGMAGVRKEQIKEIVAKLLEDASGFAECYAVLPSGAKLVLFSRDIHAEEHLKGNPILAFAKELIPEAATGYEPTKWAIPDDSWFATQTLKLQDYDVEIVFQRTKDAR
jgi:hypothetical protein